MNDTPPFKIPPAHIIPGVLYPDLKKILEVVACTYYIQIDAIYEHTRQRAISEPRMVFITIIKYALYLTNQDIAIELKMGDSNPVHARKTVRNLYLTDKAFKVKFDSIIHRLFIWESDREMIISQLLNPIMDKTKYKYWQKRKLKEQLTISNN
jgi:hypothetical protein